jgi:hypothetical protein
MFIKYPGPFNPKPWTTMIEFTYFDASFPLDFEMFNLEARRMWTRDCTEDQELGNTGNLTQQF